MAPPASPARAGGAAAPPAEGRRPNILLLISDDQAWSTFSRDLMPATFRELVDQGILFKRAYVDTSLCCPSRAQILTGLFERHTGVDANAVPLERPTFVQALHDGGYRTMLAGKYLNSWETCGPRPEFDRWACVGAPEPSTYSLLNPWINEDGEWQRRNGYQPDILADDVVEFVESTPDDQPFFAMFAPTTPHLPADDPRYDSMNVSPPHGPSFDQDTMTARSPLYARRGPLTSEEIHDTDSRFVRMSHAVRSLDDAVGHILDGLGDRTRDTIVIYLSDNGFLFGEHRRFGKTDAYEESVRVPMIVRYPALLDPEDAFTSRALVSNIDIAPSLAELAGSDVGDERPRRERVLGIEECGVAHDHRHANGLFVSVRLAEPAMLAEEEAVVGEVDHDACRVCGRRGDPGCVRRRRRATDGVRHPDETQVRVVDLFARQRPASSVERALRGHRVLIEGWAVRRRHVHGVVAQMSAGRCGEVGAYIAKNGWSSGWTR